MASTSHPELNASPICVTDLPEQILHNIFAHLDSHSLCKAAQACGTFLRLSGNADLWVHQGVLPEDKLMLASRLCLSRALHLPPQVFNLKDDLSRSMKFPLAVHFHNLRGILAVADMDEVVSMAYHGIEKQVKRAQRANHDFTNCAKADSPAAVFFLVRPERASLRFGLKERAAVTAILHGLQELGWPATLGASDAARLKDSSFSSFARSQLLVSRNLPGPSSTQLGFCTHKVKDVLGGAAPLYWSLCEGAQRCLEAAQLQGQLPELLEDWLGPAEALAQHATKVDTELAMRLRQFFPDSLQVSSVNSYGRQYYHLCSYAPDIMAALQTHCRCIASASPGFSKLMPYVGGISPNGMVELAEYMIQESISLVSSPGNPPEVLGKKLCSSDPILVARVLRLRARLHLEVLRVLNWCFFMLGTEHEQPSD